MASAAVASSTTALNADTSSAIASAMSTSSIATPNAGASSGASASTASSGAEASAAKASSAGASPAKASSAGASPSSDSWATCSAARSMSSLVTRPPMPVPCTVVISIPSVMASLATIGETTCRRSGWSDGGGVALTERSAVCSSTASMRPRPPSPEPVGPTLRTLSMNSKR